MRLAIDTSGVDQAIVVLDGRRILAADDWVRSRDDAPVLARPVTRLIAMPIGRIPNATGVRNTTRTDMRAAMRIVPLCRSPAIWTIDATRSPPISANGGRSTRKW